MESLPDVAQSFKFTVIIVHWNKKEIYMYMYIYAMKFCNTILIRNVDFSNASKLRVTLSPSYSYSFTLSNPRVIDNMLFILNRIFF